jgi:hypothetical protein
MEDPIARSVAFATEHAPALAHAALSRSSVTRLLDELEVPQPPYRMPRPAARLAAAEQPPSLDATVQMQRVQIGGENFQIAKQPTAENPNQEKTLRAIEPPAEPSPDVVQEIENAVEKIGPAENQPAPMSEQEEWERGLGITQSAPAPEAPTEEAVQAADEEARAAYLKNAQQKAVEFSGTEKKPLGSIEEEYESTEAALHRAEAAGNAGEKERLTKLLHQYDEAIQKKEMPPEVVPPAGGRKVGEEYVQGNTKVRVLEVNPATGEPSRLETVEPFHPDKTAEFKVTPEIEAARKAAAEELQRRQQEPQKPPAKSEPIPLRPVSKPGKPAGRPRGPLDADDAARVGERIAGDLQEHAIKNRDERIKKQEQEIADLKKQLEASQKSQPEQKEEQPMSRREFLGLPKESLVPEEEPHRERMGGIMGFVRESFRWTVEKTGVKPWLDTLMPRLKSVFHRRMAEWNAWDQSKTQNKLETAKGNLADFKIRMESSGFPMRLFYANRVRKWEARVNKAEARVAKYDTFRKKWQERHNDLQRQVSDRYERELAPHREKMNVLKKRELSDLQAKKSLQEIHGKALKELARLRAQATKKHWWQSTQASIEVKKAEQAVKGLERRMAQADKDIARVRAPLARAKARVDKWELKKKTVAQLMAFPETKGLVRPPRVEIPTPEQGGVEVGSAATPAERAPESPAEAERLAEEWRLDDFAKRWNGNNLKPEIENIEEFSKFVGTERARMGRTGVPKLGELLDIAERYLSPRSSAKEMRRFSSDRRFFMAQIKKQ